MRSSSYKEDAYVTSFVLVSCRSLPLLLHKLTVAMAASGRCCLRAATRPSLAAALAERSWLLKFVNCVVRRQPAGLKSACQRPPSVRPTA